MAGIKLPWQPNTWADIITAAEAVKKAEPRTTAAVRRDERRTQRRRIRHLEPSGGFGHTDDRDVVGQYGRVLQGSARDAQGTTRCSPMGLGACHLAPVQRSLAEHPLCSVRQGPVAFPRWQLDQDGELPVLAAGRDGDRSGWAAQDQRRRLRVDAVGWDFGISSHTAHPQAAAELINVMQEPTNMDQAVSRRLVGCHR